MSSRRGAASVHDTDGIGNLTASTTGLYGAPPVRTERRVAGIWIAGVLVAGVVGVVLHEGPDEPMTAAEAEACGRSVADGLGYDVVDVVARRSSNGGEWEVTAPSPDAVVRVVVRAVDGRLVDVAALRGAGADVLTRDERLAVLEAGCG